MKKLIKAFKEGDIFVKLSFIVMGLGNLARGQIVKGLVFLSFEISFIFYMIFTGVAAFSMLGTLGTVQQGMVMDPERGIFVKTDGDNSMLLLLAGVVAIFVVVLFLLCWKSSILSGYDAYEATQKGKKPNGIVQDFKDLFDKNVQRTLMFLPVTAILIFNILPLVYMILVAFTNFDKQHQPPGNLFTWVGLANFKAILKPGSILGNTFWPILGWTLTWAVFATFLNYILGIIISLLINRKETRLKGLWRTCFVMSIAVPQFVSLLVMRSMLQENGAINILLQELNLISSPLPFWTNATWARVTVIIVNLWVGIPHTILITTGVLQNIPEDLYEAAKVDGANAVVTFFKITLPYMLFVTTPYLITQFVGNMNNFNVIYFLTAGGPNTLDYYQAGKTDLLVTWLYKLTSQSFDYSYASVIGIMVFIISAVLSLITYRKTGSYNNEEGFQ